MDTHTCPHFSHLIDNGACVDGLATQDYIRYPISACHIHERLVIHVGRIVSWRKSQKHKMWRLPSTKKLQQNRALKNKNEKLLNYAESAKQAILATDFTQGTCSIYKYMCVYKLLHFIFMYYICDVKREHTVEVIWKYLLNAPSFLFLLSVRRIQVLSLQGNKKKYSQITHH